MRDAPPAELLPKALREKLDLPSLADAIVYLHRPPPDADVERMLEGTHPVPAAARLRGVAGTLPEPAKSARTRRRPSDAQSLTDGDDDGRRASITDLPFHLTGAQQRVVDEILADLAEPHPMMRLIQGDVGSGKTVVAAIACLKAIACGVQAAIMAPTEILAEQHWRSFCDWFRPLGIEPAWLSGSQRAAARRESLAAIADGSAGLVVGTHALVSGGRRVSKPRACVIDEQHRFGVHQRVALREKGVTERRPSSPARHDGNANSANAGDGRVRRPGHFDNRRIASRAAAGFHRRPS